MFVISKDADLNQFVQGGQLYLSFPFSKGSLLYATILLCIYFKELFLYIFFGLGSKPRTIFSYFQLLSVIFFHFAAELLSLPNLKNYLLTLDGYHVNKIPTELVRIRNQLIALLNLIMKPLFMVNGKMCPIQLKLLVFLIF